jgi:hypothetical protein
VRKRSLFFIVPVGILFGIGIWIIAFNIPHYFQDIEEIQSHNGRYCTNVKCVTKDDVIPLFEGYFIWGIGFLSVGGIILSVSKRWW